MAQGRFVSGNLFSFPVSGRNLAVNVIIPETLNTKFDVISKTDMPADTDNIKWFRNIGLQAKPGGGGTVSDYYEVQIDRSNFNFSKFSQYYVCVFVNNAVQELNATDFDLSYNKTTVALRLNLVDPPIGLGGR